MSGVPIGALRHRLDLQAPLDADDGAGGTIRTWQTVATLWALIEPLAAGERLAAERIEAAVDHRVTVRWRPGLTHDMRFAAGGRVFAIRGLTDRGARHRFIDCLCEEIAP